MAGNNHVLNILFGFEEGKFQKTIERHLKSLGYEANIVCKYSKNAISDYLKRNTNFDCVILKENIGRNSYSDTELAELTEERDINIIVVLSQKHKGTSYMETLYAAGITGALFQYGNETDATIDRVTDLILHKRKRVDARKYYGILEKPNIKLDKISDGKLSDLLQAIEDSSYGRDMGVRFRQVCSTLSVAQSVEFLHKMPVDTRKSLEEYDDYWVVIAALQAKGVKVSKRYEQGVRAFSKRARVQQSNKTMELEDREKKPQPKQKAAAKDGLPKSSSRPAPGNVQVNPQYTVNQPVQPKVQPIPPMPQPMPQSIPDAMSDGIEVYSDEYEEYENAEREIYGEENTDTDNNYQQPYQQQYTQQPQRTYIQQPNELPPTNDWKEMKRRQKAAEKQAKLDARQKKLEACRKPKTDSMTNQTPQQYNHQFRDEPAKPVKKSVQKKHKPAEDRSGIAIRIGIIITVIVLFALMIAVAVGVNYLTRENAAESAKENEVLTAQMNDLAEIRSGAQYDLTGVVPLTDAVSNGQQIMGIQVLDIINANIELFYVVNIDGSLFTYEGGGATSNEIDVNSMYYSQMLSSGRFAFIQQ